MANQSRKPLNFKAFTYFLCHCIIGLPVVLVLSIYVESIVMGEGFVPLSVFELDVQAVLLGAGQLVDDIIPQPVLPRQLSKALD